MRTTRVAEGKLKVLHDGGYRYNFDRQLYFNRDTQKAFSVEFIEDHPEDEIQRLVRDESSGRGSQFFFNGSVSPAVRQELANVLAR